MKWYILRIISYIPLNFARILLLKLAKAKIGKKVFIYYGTEFRAPSKLKVGNSTIIGDNCILDARGGLIIGNNVNFSTGVWIWTAEHVVNNCNFDTVMNKVEIEDYAWISCRTIILPGVKIGKGAVVAAGAVVTKSVEPFTIVGGVPAKKIGERISDLNYNLV